MEMGRRAVLAGTLSVMGSAAVAQHVHGAAADHPKTIYDDGLAVTGMDGNRLELSRLKGHPVLATMFFASCPDVCPLMTQRLLRVYSSLSAAQRAQLRVLMVSFDSELDRPAALRDYGKAQGVPTANWTLAVADPRTSQRLAELLDIQFRRLGPGSFSHTPMISLIARDGIVMARLPSASLASPLFGAAVNGLLAS